MKNDFISSVWDFSNISINETNYATHDFLRWYGKLIPQLVSKLINLYSNEGDFILANFCGSGTVLIESNILKRNSIGIDSNPLSILLSNVKTTPYIPDSKTLLNKIKTEITSKQRKKYMMNLEDKKWFYEDSFQDLMIIKETINTYRIQNDRNYFLLALASIIKKSSKIDSRCVNHIVVNNNKPKINIFDEFSKKLGLMESSMSDFKKIFSENKIQIKKGDARSINLPENSVDLIISHPPYLGAIDYSNIYKLETNFLGFNYNDIDSNDISTTSMKKYLLEMYKVFDEMKRVLKTDKYACVIIGDNRKNGLIQPTFVYFIKYATETLKLQLKDIFIWVTSQKAGMNIKRRGNYIDHNYILVFQKKT